MTINRRRLISATAFIPAFALGDSFAKSESTQVMSSEQIEAAVRGLAQSDPGLFSRAGKEASATRNNSARNEGLSKSTLSEVSSSIMKSQFPVLGNKNGLKTMAVFYDYNCGYCKRVAPVIDRLISENPQLRVVYVDLPILGKGSIESSEIGLALDSVGKFKEAHKIMMSLGSSNKDTATIALRVLGHDTEMLTANTRSKSIYQLSESANWSKRLHIKGTPHFIYIGKSKSEEHSGLLTMEELIDPLKRI